MALQVVLDADERGKIYVEKSDTGGGNVEFFGGSFWQREFPSDVNTGAYDRIIFSATLFKGAVSPRGIVSAIPTGKSKESA